MSSALPITRRTAALILLLVACVLCPACRYGLVPYLTRDGTRQEDEVTAPKPGQSPERRDPVLLPLEA